MATLVLVIGLVMFVIGIAGQFNLGRRFSKNHQPGDRRGVRLVLTLAALIVGAWLVIASASSLLKAHSRAPQHSQAFSAQPSALSTRPNRSTAAVVKITS